jgi:hypothetical protein
MADGVGYSVLEPTESRWEAAHDDGRGSLALAGGLLAALVGGLIWAAIVLFARLEIGWAAWGVGALVGMVIGRTTIRRSRNLGIAAAGLAATGLIIGKLAISWGSVGALTKELAQTPEHLEGIVAWQMYEAHELSQATLEEVASTLAAGDTLSDQVWAEMRQQAGAKLAQMTPAERQANAREVASGYLNQLGILGGIMVQLGLWDLLWFGLAMATAYGMASGGRVERAPARV